MRHQKLNALLLSFIFLILCACSKINKENYDKVQQGMPQDKVYSLLGQPTKSNEIKIGRNSGITATWTKNNETVFIIFINNKVFKKSYIREQNKDKNQTQDAEIDIN